MKQSIQYACWALVAAGLLVAGQATATVVNFTAGEGYADGDLTNNVDWATDASNGGLGGNIVSTTEIGYSGEAGVVTMAGYTNWIKGIYSEDLPLDAPGKMVTAKARFKYTATGFLTTAGQNIGVFSLLFDDGNGGIVRTALRRRNSAGTPQVFLWNATFWSSPLADETAVGIDMAADESDWLELTITLVKNSSTGTDDWSYFAVLTNLVTGLEMTRYQNDGSFSVPPTMATSSSVRGTISSTMNETATLTDDRKIDRFEVTSGISIPPTTIIGGSVGDGDFEYPTEPGGANGALAFSNHPSWFNASQWEGETFTLTNNSGGSSQPNSRAAMAFQLRKQVNSTGYDVTSAGVTLDLSYDFGRVGSGWDGDESMRTFLFTADAPVDGALGEANMTEFAEVIYTFPTNEFWTSFSANAFYTTTEADIGKTFYFGMVHLNPAGSAVFPRVDVVRLSANENKWAIIRGATGDGDFEFPTETGGLNGGLAFSNHPNWFNASQWEGEVFSLTNQTGGSSQPDSRAAMAFQLRKQVNNTGYTVVAAGQEFDLSYDLGRVGSGWDGDESMRTFLFTADAPVDGALAESNMTEFAEVIYTFPTNEFWTSFETNAFYTTTESDVGKTVYFGMVHLNPAGDPVFPRIDVVDLCVTLVDAAVAPVGPVLSILLNGTNLDISWDSETGSSYQLQTNSDMTTTNWSDYGSAVPGDGNSMTNVVPVAGDELFIRATVQ